MSLSLADAASTRIGAPAPTAAPGTGRHAAALDLQDLCVGYRGRPVASGLTARGLGGVVGLLGPNGSGKTTLIKTLAGVHRALGGSVRVTVDGVTVPTRRSTGYVPQDLPDSVSLTAMEAVLVAARRSVAGNPVRAAAETLDGLGLAAVASRHLGELSGGQRQLVAVAQVLVADPPAMLLDEPTSALDLHRQLHLLEIVRDRTRRRGAVAVVSLHDINLAARYCDRLLVLDRGRLTADGTPQDVLTPALLREVYRVDAEVLGHRGAPLVVPAPLSGAHPAAG